MIIRSLLYVPGSNPRFIEKAHTRGADAIIIDLEDAVAASKKTEARQALHHTVPMAGRTGTPVFVRINNTSERLLSDAEAACRAGAYGLYVPKVENTALLETLVKLLEPMETEIGREPTVFVPLVESAAGVLAAAEIGRGPRVFALSGGGEDLATSMGAKPVPQVLNLPKQLIHLAAKATGVRSFGLLRTVTDYNDLEGMRHAASEARMFGFDGASCIHPSVVSILNEAFSPSSEEIEWARRIIAADTVAAANGEGAYTVDGEFVDAPIVRRAQEIMKLARSIETTIEVTNG